MMAASTSDTMTPVAPPFMALALNSDLPRATQLDQKTIQVWTLYAREGRMRNDRAGPFFVHTMNAFARSTQFPATPHPQLRTKSLEKRTRGNTSTALQSDSTGPLDKSQHGGPMGSSILRG